MSAATSPNPKSQLAEAYVQKHRIPELFENMTAAIIHTQPENAKKFMIKYLENLKMYREEKGDYPAMFTDANITSVFGMLDVTNNGYISMEQYRSGTYGRSCSMTTSYRKIRTTRNHSVVMQTESNPAPFPQL